MAPGFRAQKQVLLSSVASSEPDELAGPIKQSSDPRSVGHGEPDELAGETKTPIPSDPDVIAPALAPTSTPGALGGPTEDYEALDGFAPPGTGSVPGTGTGGKSS